jgi:predicted enzyme related to lactoylglutathione lyase
MKRVIGIGGIFIKSKNPDKLKDWYRTHLGMNLEDWGGMSFPPNGTTIWSVFEDSSSYFDPSQAPFMVNYRVEDLHAVLDVLKKEGCDVDPKTEASAFGKFGWVMDPDGNRIELWEPPLNPAGT